MGKRVTLKLSDGSLETGFFAILQIGDEGGAPTVEISGQLPPAFYLQSVYKLWQANYWQLGTPNRIQVSEAFATNVSLVGDCANLADDLKRTFNQWLHSAAFRPLQDKLLERLSPNDTIQFILQTGNVNVQRLPWHLWTICDRYPKLEIALGAPSYEKRAIAPASPRQKIRILAILGHSEGLDLKTDCALLNHLPNAEVHFLPQPTRQTLDAHLWDRQGWDILFFAGHSATQCLEGRSDQSGDRGTGQSGEQSIDSSAEPSAVGKIYINPTESITIPQLKNALRKALTHGLKIAIFNSCDGLGLAQALSDLHISQVLVMREPIPDQVAHTFLKSFLEAFSRGESFFLAVREAREKLQGLEDRYPCASWLPTIFQNPAEASPHWNALLRQDVPGRSFKRRMSDRVETLSAPKTRTHRPGRAILLGTHLFVIALLIGLKSLGLFQGWELKAFDQFMRSRPPETPDPRLVVITITPEDIRRQNDEERRGSLSDATLLKLLNKLEMLEPRVIGLDIYRDFPVKANLPALATKLENTSNLFAVCKSGSTANSSPTNTGAGIPGPPEVPAKQVGFSDFLIDPDGVVRRQLISLTPEVASLCGATYSLNALLALKYLDTEGHAIATSNEGYLQVGEVVFSPLMANAGGYQNIHDGGHQLLLNYRSFKDPEQIADRVTLREVLDGTVNPEALRDRIILIGTTDNSYPDDWQTPYSKSPNPEHRTAGVFMQAQMVSQLISAVENNRPPLKTWPEVLENVWVVLWGGVGSLIIIHFSRRRSKVLSHPQLLLAFFLTELGLLGLCWLLLVNACTWVPWVVSAIAPIAVASSYPFSQRLSVLFFNSNA